jgi:hypothetical protein
MESLFFSLSIPPLALKYKAEREAKSKNVELDQFKPQFQKED